MALGGRNGYKRLDMNNKTTTPTPTPADALLVLVWALAAGALLWGSGLDTGWQVWLWDNYHQGFNTGMRVLGELGKGTALAVGCALAGGGWLLAAKLRHAPAPRAAWLVLGAVPVFALAGAVNWLLKWGIGRARPKEFLMNGGDPWQLAPFAGKAVWWSFPSGHSCSAFAVAVWLGLVFPRRMGLFVAAAVVLSVSRFLAITPHYAGDVVAGAGVGAAVAMAAWTWLQRRAAHAA